MSTSEISMPIRKPVDAAQLGDNGFHYSIKSPIFGQYEKLGEGTYVFYIVGNKGQEIKIPQSQLLQFLNGLKNESARSNLLRFFNSTNLARLSRLQQGRIYKINLNIALSGGDPIKEIESSLKLDVAAKSVEKKDTPITVDNLAQTFGSDGGTVYTYSTGSLAIILRDLGFMSREDADAVNKALGEA